MFTDRIFENDQLQIMAVRDVNGDIKNITITLRDGTVLIDDKDGVTDRYRTFDILTKKSEPKDITVDEILEDDFEVALDNFLKYSQNLVDEYMKKYPGQYKKLSLERGRRYIRVVAWDGVQRSAWAFVDTKNGDVLKPASWKAPAKHARGNIYRKPYTVTAYGPPYLK